jgi:hypothetical protein
MDLKEQETTRPQFKGEYRRDEITGERGVHYITPWKRYIKYAISFPITLAFTAGTLVLILMADANRDLMLANDFQQKNPPGSEEFHLEFRISAIGRTPTDPFSRVELGKYERPSILVHHGRPPISSWSLSAASELRPHENLRDFE